MRLIAGATGLLGGEICRLLSGERKAVRALVRPTSSAGKQQRLQEFGVELAFGDLKDRASLDAACRGVSAVISTVSSTLSRQHGDSIESVDHQGQLNLIKAAEKANVEQFVLISFPATDIEFPLQSAKRAVEERLRHGRMSYTILQPTCFMEVWLDPALGFDVANARAQIYGSGGNKTSWISAADVARFAVAALGNPHAFNVTIKLGGPEALSPLDVVRVSEEVTGRAMAVQHVPEAALRAQYAAATDPLQRSFAGLMLYYASGDAIDPTDALKLLPATQLRSVHDHFRTVTAHESERVELEKEP